jgi:hypothetical protein
MSCAGFEGLKLDPPSAFFTRTTESALARRLNPANRTIARAIRREVSAGYQPIDWQLDFKSGYRWSERCWYRDIRFGGVGGADVKVPWELSRMQHLPDLAVAFAGNHDQRIATEFTDQVLDWIAANPPRYGVNWVCTMDVGIRVANWLLAFDLLRAAGVRFGATFERLFAASVLDHTQHIVTNLEWSETRRGNHYLGNIAGLLFGAAYLPAGERTDAWLAFAVQELMIEADRQFLPDGGHFEASTCYHNLCAEILAVCAALLHALPEERIRGLFNAAPRKMRYGSRLSPRTPANLRHNYETTSTLLSREFYAKLALAAAFSRSLTRPDGTVVQIGDNDSGRLLRLGAWVELGTVAACRAKYANLSGFAELPDHDSYVAQEWSSNRQWLAWASAVLRDEQWLDRRYSDVSAPAAALARALTLSSNARAACDALECASHVRIAASATSVTKNTSRSTVTHRMSGTYRPGGADLLTNASFEAFPDFGVYVVRSDRLYLTIRCGFARHDGVGVHAHEDQLSVDITIDGRTVVADPGTYVYTPSSVWRHRYRRAHAHCAPAVDGPVESATPGIFSGTSIDRGKCLSFGPAGFVGEASVPGGSVVRRIVLHGDCIVINDEYSLHAQCRPAAVDLFRAAAPVAFSPGYGIRLA